jgi:hypothetical protein
MSTYVNSPSANLKHGVAESRRERRPRNLGSVRSQIGMKFSGGYQRVTQKLRAQCSIYFARDLCFGKRSIQLSNGPDQITNKRSILIMVLIGSVSEMDFVNKHVNWRADTTKRSDADIE